MLNLELATEEHIAHVAANLRESDLEELEVIYGTDPYETFMSGLEMSDVCQVLTLDGEAISLFGVHEGHTVELGHPWMVGTEKLNHEKRTLLTVGREIVQGWLGLYPVLLNIVLAKNKPTINYIKLLGFTVLDPQPLDGCEEDVCVFTLERELSHV